MVLGYKMTAEIVLLSSAAFVGSAIGTELLRRHALRAGLMDTPNERSSHSRPTPRGGGLAIVAVVSILVSILGLLRSSEIDLVLAILAGGVSIAIVGMLDDRNMITIRSRFLTHLLAAIFALYMLGGIGRIELGTQFIDFGEAGNLLSVVAIIWTLNLFNFMDGIDGIAASEAVFVTVAGGVLAIADGIGPAVPYASLILGGAALGFLIWNWAPAKIFMGDVGSGYLGYLIAVLALSASRESGVTLFVWLILGGVFFADATVTLVRRVARGEKPYVAHRSHAYQQLARRWGSHSRVTLLVSAVNVGWLLPMAWACLRLPEHAVFIVFLALGPLTVLALLAGAGKSEHRNANSGLPPGAS